MYDGVGKSGSPAPKPITGRPAALSAFALASTARVADSVMALTRSEIRRWAAVIRPSCHHRGRARVVMPPVGSTAALRATTLHTLVAVQLRTSCARKGVTGVVRRAPPAVARSALTAATITGQ